MARNQPAPSRSRAVSLRRRSKAGGAGKRLLVSLVLLSLPVGLGCVMVLLAEQIVNGDARHPRSSWLHAADLPAEVVFAALLAAALVAFVVYIFRQGVDAIRSALRRIFGGCWVDGMVTARQSVKTEHVSDEANDYTYDSFTWQVAFNDQHTRSHFTEFHSRSDERRQVSVGARLRVRYQVSDPSNAIAVHPGVSPRIANWVHSIVALGFWGFFGAWLPVGLVVLGLIWLYRNFF